MLTNKFNTLSLHIIICFFVPRFGVSVFLRLTRASLSVWFLLTHPFFFFPTLLYYIVSRSMFLFSICTNVLQKIKYVFFFHSTFYIKYSYQRAQPSQR